MYKIKFLDGTQKEFQTLCGANLQGANLWDADLEGANLRGANLQGADLRRAYLRDANLQEADLQGADLQYADFQGANLWGAELRRAHFKDTNFQGAVLDFQLEAGLLRKIATKLLKEGGGLDMDSWHSDCGTAHCIAGWACTLAKNGGQLEEQYGPELAGLLLLGAEAHTHFYDSDRDAWAYLESIL